MNFSKLPKEKRNHLVLVVLGALMAVAGLYICLIQHQNDNLSQLVRKKENAAKKLKLVLETVKRADQIQADLDEARTALAGAERDVASGDLYAWVINWLRGFKASYKVEIPQFSQLSPPAEVNLLPKFPYKQTTLTVAGTAHFHDLGLFFADLENQFPHVRLLNLTLDSSPPSVNSEPETLSFKVDIVTLAKVNPS
jgi:Tfp pilus assembly protein PilO